MGSLMACYVSVSAMQCTKSILTHLQCSSQNYSLIVLFYFNFTLNSFQVDTLHTSPLNKIHVCTFRTRSFCHSRAYMKQFTINFVPIPFVCHKVSFLGSIWQLVNIDSDDDLVPDRLDKASTGWQMPRLTALHSHEGQPQLKISIEQWHRTSRTNEPQKWSEVSISQFQLCHYFDANHTRYIHSVVTTSIYMYTMWWFNGIWL